jgi:hypothetical protein
MRIEVADWRARRLLHCDALSVAVGFVYGHRSCSCVSLLRRSRPCTHFTTATEALVAAAAAAQRRALVNMLRALHWIHVALAPLGNGGTCAGLKSEAGLTGKA